MTMRAYLPPLLLFAVALLQYANTLEHDYAWDDKLVITGNEYTLKGVSGIPTIFAHRVSVPGKNVYRPVPQALFAIEYDLFNGNPHAGHFFNVLWYAVLVVIVYYFLRFVFPSAPPLLPFFTALLFAVHPLHTEVAANIKSRDEILALLFGLPALVYFVRSADKGKGLFLVPALLLMALACLSKENAICLLPVAPLIAWYRSGSSRIKFSLPLLLPVMTGLAAAIAWGIYSLGSTRSSSVHLDATVLNNIFLWTTEPGKVVPTALVNVGRYLGLFLWPHPLIHMYGYNQVVLAGWSSPATISILLLLGWVAYYVATRWSRRCPAVFGILFFACTYAIYSNLFVLAPDTMADRYLFMPSLGLCIILVFALFQLPALKLPQIRLPYIQLPQIRSPQTPRINGYRMAVVTSSLLAIAFFARSFFANRDWQNDYTLIDNRIQYMKDNAAAQATYGYMRDKEAQGMPEGAERREKKAAAMQAWMRSVQIYPDFAMPWISMGRLFAQQGVYDKAECCFLKALSLGPQSADAVFCLGALDYTTGDGKMATAYLERAVVLDPAQQPAFVLLGRAYLLTGDIANLGSMTETAVKWFPANGDLAALRAVSFYRSGRPAEARSWLGKALSLDPNNVTALSLQETIRSGGEGPER